MTYLLLPAGGPDSAAHFEASVGTPIDSDRLDVWIPKSDADRVRAAAGGDQLGAWGLRDNTKDLPGSGVEPIIWDRISAGTVALFSNHDEYFSHGTVIGKSVSEAASRELWGSPDFRWLIWLSEIRDTSIPLEVVRAGGGFSPSYKLNRQALVPRAHREAGLETALAPFLEASGGTREEPTATASVTRIPPEAVKTDTFEVRSSTTTREARRREAALVQTLREWWAGRDGPEAVCGLEIRPEGSTARLYVDLFNAVTNELVEAKASCDRTAIRMAIGQLADYRRFITPEPSVKALLPEAPDNDLLTLLASENIAVLFPRGDGFAEVSRVTPSATS